jgi:lipoprotein-anchoring transpeptidase ErfK/SrfK
MRHVFPALVMSVLGIVSAGADPLSLKPDNYGQAGAPPRLPAYLAPQLEPAPVAAEPTPAVRYAATNSEVNLGGGFIEFLFSGGPAFAPPRPPSDVVARAEPYQAQPEAAAEPAHAVVDQKYVKQVVAYRGPEKPGTVIIDTPQRFLFLVQDNGQSRSEPHWQACS